MERQEILDGFIKVLRNGTTKDRMMYMQKMTRQEILDGFIKVCRKGTSKDCRMYVQDAKMQGITYEELCAYKRQKEEEERKAFITSQIKKGCDKCSQWDDYWGCNKCESI